MDRSSLPLLPLSSVDLRVLDMADARGEMCGRFLADLGADVIKVEPVGGGSSRCSEPVHEGVSLPFQVRNANKRSLELDLDAPRGRERLLELLAGADIWIESCSRAELERYELTSREVHEIFPHLVIVSLTDFGHTGPYRDWSATNLVLLALSGMLSRSGVPGRPPMMPPGDLADESTAIQAAWVALLAYWSRLETGIGDVLDFSRHESTAQILDPPFGSIGTAAAQSGIVTTGRGRMESLLYPIYPCREGHVRLVILAPRQWRGMWDWLGQPQEFSDPTFDQVRVRFAAAARLYPLIAALFRDQSASELVAEGQRRGVPVAPVLAPVNVLSAPHFEARTTFVEPTGLPFRGRVPSGHILMDGHRIGPRRAAPLPGQYGGDAKWSRYAVESGVVPPPRRPLDGVRVLDLGVIVMGGEAGRLFADQGADVIKVENRRFPDGARMSGMTPRFASGHRNKRAIGIDLRDPEGIELFRRLVAHSDVVLTNFKPGTLESLGIGPEELREINPQVVVVTSSAMGESGPWRDWMGYGPLVRCVSGLTYLWRDPEVDEGFGDGSTIFPDHLVARVVGVSVLAALIARRKSGLGAHVESAQAESVIMALGTEYLHESVAPGANEPHLHGERNAPWGIYPCAGDDEWCVITVRGDEEWTALIKLLGSPPWSQDPVFATCRGRLGNRDRLDRELAAWTTRQSPSDVMVRLQSAGIAAAMMKRAQELPDDPHLQERQFFRRFHQPGLVEEVVTENGPCLSLRLPEPELRPAPFYGQHTREVVQETLGLGDDEVDALVRSGALDEMSEKDRELVISSTQVLP
jgi:crotonobetainyl-CoA:carnitine CoA-transferase CaiB-like acyl-CoA transferase